jgi:hypothetical protein
VKGKRKVKWEYYGIERVGNGKEVWEEGRRKTR